MTIISREPAMLPHARRIYSSCLRFMRELPVDLPALPRREDAAEWVTLTEAAPLTSRVQQEKTDGLPFQLQDATPFRHRRRRGLKLPPPGRGPRVIQTGPVRIPVNGINNSRRKRKAPSIDLLMGLHGGKCSTPEDGTRSEDTWLRRFGPGCKRRLGFHVSAIPSSARRGTCTAAEWRSILPHSQESSDAT